MRKSRHAFMLAALGAWLLCAAPARAADPGLIYPASSEINDQKAGSVLIYNLFSSSATPATEDTRISLTNHSTTSRIFVRLFFVNGASGSAINLFICLLANETMVFQASAVDPGVRGYIIALAVNDINGCPINFNFLG